MEYKYLMRMDDDSCILDNINFDIFQYLNHKKAAYAYTYVWRDGEKITRGLYDFVDDYVLKNNLTWKNPALHNDTLHYKKFPHMVPAFNTNFEVLNTVRYRDPAVMHFVNAVSDSNMIFHRRWGDAPLRTPMVQLFWTERELVRLGTSFELSHSVWGIYPLAQHSDSNNPNMTW